MTNPKKIKKETIKNPNKIPIGIRKPHKKTNNELVNKQIQDQGSTSQNNIKNELDTNESIEECIKPKKQPEKNVVLTIDVGIKNLAMCIMDWKYNIYLWDVYNMLDEEAIQYSCFEKVKNDGKPCVKRCQYKFPRQIVDKITGVVTIIDTVSCKKHVPKDIKPIENKYFIKDKKVGDYLLQDITERTMKNLRHTFETHQDIFKTVTHVCIELQPKVNQRMKFTSHIIYATFVDLYNNHDDTKKNIPIRFIRASQNLQAYTGPEIKNKYKTPYANRKYKSIEYIKWYLEQDILNTEFNRNQKLMEKLSTHIKKDDMCDVANANINVHKGLSKKQKQNKNGSEIK